MSDPVFLKNQKNNNNIINLSSAELAQRVVKVNSVSVVYTCIASDKVHFSAKKY